MALNSNTTSGTTTTTTTSTGMVTAPITQKYNLGPVKSWVANAGNLLGNMFGIKTEYGWRQSDPFPDHPSGHAIDFMISSTDQGQRLADYAVAHYQELGISYVIWNHQVWNATQGWHPYTSTNNPHTDHVHITFTDSPAAWTSSPSAGAQASTDSGAGAGTAQTATLAGSETCAWTVGSFCVLSKRQTRVIVGSLILTSGALIGLVSIVLLSVYGLQKTGATRLLPPQVRRFI